MVRKISRRFRSHTRTGRENPPRRNGPSVVEGKTNPGHQQIDSGPPRCRRIEPSIGGFFRYSFTRFSWPSILRPFPVRGPGSPLMVTRTRHSAALKSSVIAESGGFAEDRNFRCRRIRNVEEEQFVLAFQNADNPPHATIFPSAGQADVMEFVSRCSGFGSGALATTLP